MKKVALIIDNDELFKGSFVNALWPAVEVVFAKTKDAKEKFDEGQFDYIVIGNDKNLVKYIRTKFTGTMIAATKYSENYNNKLLSAGCNHKIKRENAAKMLLEIFENDNLATAAKIKYENQIKTVGEFKDMIEVFTNLYFDKKIDSIEGAEKMIKEIINQANKLKDYKIIIQAEKIQSILYTLKRCELATKNIYAENLQAEIAGLSDLTIDLK